METIRAKFKCETVTKMTHWNKPGDFLFNAAFSPVTGGSEENKKFWEATPGGKLEVFSVVSDKFVPGKCYYLDISEAP